ncbi:MAG TPA: hypothetical protein DCZ10_06305 [Pelotomaculum sp.]|jgi:hypothetical protein|nr:hypothetical protein [Pelotomaculum sp.]HCX77821.1 hypothetical protein [Bacillota bacterium]
MQSVQARHLQQWVEDQVAIEEPTADDFAKWMDKIGQVLIYLALFFGTITLVAQVGIWRGWW